jgi:protoheme ferro-lyase
MTPLASKIDRNAQVATLPRLPPSRNDRVLAPTRAAADGPARNPRNGIVDVKSDAGRPLPEAHVQFVWWATALIASIAAGAAVCAALVSRRRWIPAWLVAAAAALTITATACRVILQLSERADAIIAAVAISLGGCAGGFALGAASVTALTSRRKRTVQLEFGPERGGTDVVLLSDEEPGEYDPAAVTAALARYDDGEIDLPPEVARPLVYASERARYRSVGGSPARGTVLAMADRLAKVLGADGTTDRVSAAFTVGSPSLDEVVARVVSEGGRRVVVVPLAAAWSPAFAASFEGLPRQALTAHGVRLETAEPLWSSPHLSAMVAQRALASLGGDRSTDGVVLLSEGDPWEHARAHETYREQLTFFVQRVRADMIAAGVAADRIRRAYLWLEEPDIAEAVRHLTAIGARTIVLVPATFPAETVATLVDIRYAAERAAADTGVAVTMIAPWGDDPAVAEALRDSVVAAMDRSDGA